MSERRCDWHGEVDHEAIGKRITAAVRAPQDAAPTAIERPCALCTVLPRHESWCPNGEPQEGAPNSQSVVSARPTADTSGVPSYDSELARIATNLSHSADHHSNHWIEDCRTLLRIVDELELVAEQRKAWAFAWEAAAAKATKERDDLRAKLADAKQRWIGVSDVNRELEAKLAEAEKHGVLMGEAVIEWSHRAEIAETRLDTKEKERAERHEYGQKWQAEAIAQRERAEAAEARVRNAKRLAARLPALERADLLDVLNEGTK